MKTCNKCGHPKPMILFRKRSKSKDGLRQWCKECDKQWYQDNHAAQIARVRKNNAVYLERARDAIWARLLNGCVDCEESDPTALTFDHRDPSKKMMDISKHSSGRVNNLPALIEELAKCDVRCANCHHKKTAKDQRHWTWKRLNAQQVA